MDDWYKLAAQSGAPAWIVGILGALVLIATAAPRILGPLSQTIHDWAMRRRQAAVARDDADINERDRMIKHLSETSAKKQALIEAYELAAFRHRVWDMSVLHYLPEGHPPPPSLWVPDRPEKQTD